MSYRQDEDLEFLREMSSEDLNDLVETLVWKNGGKILTGTLSGDSLYKEHYPDHEKYLDRIMEEIQRFGGNTFANVFRGHGVLYKEIVRDVAKKLKVKYDKEASTPEIEMEIYLKIFSGVVEKMSEEEREKMFLTLRQGVSVSIDKYKSRCPDDIFQIAKTTMRVVGTAGNIVKLVRFIAAGTASSSMKTTVLQFVANLVCSTLLKHGIISAGTNLLLTRVASVLAGPVGLAISGIWTAISLAGPAHRVTVPVVIRVAYLRTLSKQGSCDAPDAN